MLQKEDYEENFANLTRVTIQTRRGLLPRLPSLVNFR